MNVLNNFIEKQAVTVTSVMKTPIWKLSLFYQHILNSFSLRVPQVFIGFLIRYDKA